MDDPYDSSEDDSSSTQDPWPAQTEFGRLQAQQHVEQALEEMSHLRSRLQLRTLKRLFDTLYVRQQITHLEHEHAVDLIADELRQRNLLMRLVRGLREYYQLSS